MTPWAAPLSYYVYPRHGIRCILVRGPPRVGYIPGPGLPNSIHPGSSLPSPVFVPRCKSFISAYDPSNSAQGSRRIQNGNCARPARPPPSQVTPIHPSFRDDSIGCPSHCGHRVYHGFVFGQAVQAFAAILLKFHPRSLNRTLFNCCTSNRNMEELQKR